MAVRVAAHEHVGQRKQSVAVMADQLGQAVRQVVPQGRRVQRHDGAHDRIAVAQSAFSLVGAVAEHQVVRVDQWVDQAVIDVDGWPDGCPTGGSVLRSAA